MSLVLDIGCGDNKRGAIGVDIRRTTKVDVICDAHYLPFVNNAFDGCYAYAVLEHVTDPLRVMNEINRVLHDKAWLKVLVPTDSRLKSDYLFKLFSLNFKGFLITYHAMKAGVHKWQYREPSLKRLLKLFGFKVGEAQYPPCPWVGRRKALFLMRLGIIRHSILTVECQKERVD